MPYQMTDEEFDAAMQEALDSMPERFTKALDNLCVAWQPEPDPEMLGIFDDGEDLYEDGGYDDAPDASYDDPGDEEGEYYDDDDDDYAGELLGLYEGIPLTERGNDYGFAGEDLPDVITVFKGPHERMFGSREQIVEEIRKTVIHEMGHYFGLDEDQIARMGYE